MAGQLTPVIQANSLADVVELAENPPKDPRAPVSRQAQEPLVLYIARVPGSRGSLRIFIGLSYL